VFDSADRDFYLAHYDLENDPGRTEALGVACEGAGLQPYAAKYHTNNRQLAELAGKAKPRLLIVYHASIVMRPAMRPLSSRVPDYSG
jgi:hypothetical protein